MKNYVFIDRKHISGFIEVKCWISEYDSRECKRLHVAGHNYDLIIKSQHIFIDDEDMFSRIQNKNKIKIVSNEITRVVLLYDLYIKPDMSLSERTKLLLKSHRVERK